MNTFSDDFYDFFEICKRENKKLLSFGEISFSNHLNNLHKKI